MSRHITIPDRKLFEAIFPSSLGRADEDCAKCGGLGLRDDERRVRFVLVSCSCVPGSVLPPLPSEDR